MTTFQNNLSFTFSLFYQAFQLIISFNDRYDRQILFVIHTHAHMRESKKPVILVIPVTENPETLILCGFPQLFVFSKAVTNLSFTCHFSSTGRNPSSFSVTSKKTRSVAVLLNTNPFSSRFLKNGFGLWYFRPQFSQYSLYLS